MLCEACIQALHRNRDLIWNSTLDETFKHHRSSITLQLSAGEGCAVCCTVAQLLKPTVNVDNDEHNVLRTRLYMHTNGPGQTPQFYVDFDREGGPLFRFVLTETSKQCLLSWRQIL
jgi:hypothetical protein